MIRTLAFQERGREGGRNLEHQDDVAYALTAPSGGSRAQEKNVLSFAFDSTFGVNSNVFTEQTPPVKVGSSGNSGNPPAMVQQTIGFYQEGGSHNMCVENVSPTLKAPGQEQSGSAHAAVLAFDVKQSGESVENVAPTLRAMTHDPSNPKSHLNGGGQVGVLGYGISENQRCELHLTDYVRSVSREGGKPGQGYPAVLTVDRPLTDEEKVWAHAAVARIRRSDEYVMDEIASTISARDYKSATDIVIDPATPVGYTVTNSSNRAGWFTGDKVGTICSAGHNEGSAFQHGVLPVSPEVAEMIDTRDFAAMPIQVGRPRRLIPEECELLMGWPAGWTQVPDAKGKPASDAVRYKAIGNGVVSHIPQWIGERLWWAYAAYLHHEWWSNWAEDAMDGKTTVDWDALRAAE